MFTLKAGGLPDTSIVQSGKKRRHVTSLNMMSPMLLLQLALIFGGAVEDWARSVSLSAHGVAPFLPSQQPLGALCDSAPW